MRWSKTWPLTQRRSASPATPNTWTISLKLIPKDHSELISYTTPNVALEFESPDTARIIATTYTGGAALAYLDRDDADTIYQYYFED